MDWRDLFGDFDNNREGIVRDIHFLILPGSGCGFRFRGLIWAEVGNWETGINV